MVIGLTSPDRVDVVFIWDCLDALAGEDDVEPPWLVFGVISALHYRVHVVINLCVILGSLSLKYVLEN